MPHFIENENFSMQYTRYHHAVTIGLQNMQHIGNRYQQNVYNIINTNTMQILHLTVATAIKIKN